jgi:hypothetical protein
MAGRIGSAAVLALAGALALAGCQGSGSADPAATRATAEATAATPPAPPVTAGSGPATAASQATGSSAFAVSGDNPVVANGSQSTYAATPGAVCDSAQFAQDMSTGRHVVDGFELAGFGVSADLLEHFLKGAGTAVDYPAGSPIAKLALANSAFLAVNEQVQGAILAQLRAGTANVRLTAGQLPLVAFESPVSDLYWGFRGTQGLAVTGSGARAGGRYVGTLTYVIRDSYGFPADDTLDGFGSPMRYLQTVCGAPQHPGGAHWFPDSITVTAPFNQPA